MTTQEHDTPAPNSRRQDDGEATIYEDAVEEQSPDPDVESLDDENRIEVKAFLERKTWIQDKIKLLESMPPIDVFYGVDQILPVNAGVPVQGLPTRQEVAAWISEHDNIEAETEKFDKGDMIRLKKFAKAKSEQSLSPEDTDLIELTLDTLFSLDKLIHLLRVRSSTLQSMDLRLRWEELRVGAWRDRQALLDDLDTFVKTKARWSVAVYEEVNNAIPGGSNTTSLNSTESPAAAKFFSLSRGARYKHAEQLSREAAAYSTRVLSFHNNWIASSGHVLDKLIEKKTVPDQLLDEQDRLENQSKILDAVSKFPMQLVMQWKKADEIYGELKTDQSTAGNLLADLQKALQAHPRSRMNEEFSSRGAALNSRLTQISDPATSRSFPRPINPAYPDQKQGNDALATLLSNELRAVIKTARQISSAAKQYHTLTESVQSVRKLNGEMAVLIADFTATTEKLIGGYPSSAKGGDGTPPSIETASCLDPARHAMFLALLPNLSAELLAREKTAERVTLATQTTLLSLREASLESTFLPDTESFLSRLSEARESAFQACREAERRADLIRGARSISEAIIKAAQDLLSMRERVLQVIERQKWKAERGRDGAPLTPDSPTLEPVQEDDLHVEDALRFGQDLSRTVTDHVTKPCSTLLPALGSKLAGHIGQSYDDLSTSVEQYKDLVQIWQDVLRQANVMRGVRDETYTLESRMDDLRTRIREVREYLETGHHPADRIREETTSEDLATPLATLRRDVERFQSELARRVPFVSRSPGGKSGSTHPLRPSALDHLTFSASALDHAVKTDVNAFSISLSTGLDSLNRHLDILKLAELGKEVDKDITSTTDELRRVEERASSLSAAVLDLNGSDDLQLWESTIRQIREEFASTIGDSPARLRTLFTSAAKSLKALESAPGAQDLMAHESIVLPRKRAVSDAARRSEALVPKLQALQEDISLRIQGVSAGRKLELALLNTTEELRIANEALSRQQNRVNEVALDRPEAFTVLTEYLERLDSDGREYRKRLGAAVSNLKKARTAVQSSSSFRNAYIFALLRPKVDEAIRVEGLDESLEPALAGLKLAISQKLHLIEAVRGVDKQITTARADMGVMRQTLSSLSERYQGMAVKDVPEVVLEDISKEVGQLRESHTSTAASAVASLKSSLVTIQQLQVSRHSSAASLVHAVIQNVDTVATAQVDIQSHLHQLSRDLDVHTSLSRHGGVVDDKLDLATRSLEEAQSRLAEITAGFDTVIASFGSRAMPLDTSASVQLVKLRTRSDSLMHVLERTVGPLLQDARLAAEDLQAKADAAEAGLRATIVALREIKVKDINHTYSKCVEDLNRLSTNIVEAEATENQRTKRENEAREQAEHERMRIEQEERERLEAEALLAREAELERTRLDADEKLRKMAEETAQREQAERQARLAAETEAKRIADELMRLQETERQRLKAEEEATAERLRSINTEEFIAGIEDLASSSEEVDVFGVRRSPTSRHKRTISKEELDIHSRLVGLRARLRSLSLHTLVRASGSPSKSKTSSFTPLPTESNVNLIKRTFEGIVMALAALPPRLEDPVPQAELRSLQFEIEASRPLVTRLEALGEFSSLASEADIALSDMLEHLDNYPLPPAQTASAHESDLGLTPREQLSARVGFTGAAVDAVKRASESLMDDQRVSLEKDKLEQTWSELWDMSMEKINSLRSRPPSIRNLSDTGSQAASGSEQPQSIPRSRPMRGISSLSLSNNNGSRPTSNAPSHRVPTYTIPASRSHSRISNRSVSGPLNQSNASSYGSTFASRQRTTSNSSIASNVVGTPTRSSMSRSRLLPNQGTPMSPAISEFGSTPTSTKPFSFNRTPRSSFHTPGSVGASGRHPRTSTSARVPTNPPKKVRKHYVPNEKHKVDVAVAEVVNNLDPDMDVNIEPVSWKDQSGKYWIGDKDPKLCFCRILRSQTVMVRVGGGWLELSKFLRGHFELFRVAPPPMIPGSPLREEEERWISSATLLAAEGASPSIVTQGPEESDLVKPPPVTPEPRRTTKTSLTAHDASASQILGLNSPLAVLRQSPRNSSSTSGSSPHAASISPLTPLQFLRRAEDGSPHMHNLPPRASTPSRLPSQPLTKPPLKLPAQTHADTTVGRATPDAKASTSGRHSSAAQRPPRVWRP